MMELFYSSVILNTDNTSVLYHSRPLNSLPIFTFILLLQFQVFSPQRNSFLLQEKNYGEHWAYRWDV